MNQIQRIIFLFILFLIFSSVCQANELIELEAPDKWKLDYIQHGAVHSYMLVNEDVEISVLYFSTPPLPIEESDTKKIIDEEISFYSLKAKQRLEENTDITKVEKQEIEGEFSGFSIIMFHRDNFLLALFSITNGHTVLSGYFTGPSEKWATATTIIKSIKYKG